MSYDLYHIADEKRRKLKNWSISDLKEQLVCYHKREGRGRGRFVFGSIGL